MGTAAAATDRPDTVSHRHIYNTHSCVQSMHIVLPRSQAVYILARPITAISRKLACIEQWSEDSPHIHSGLKIHHMMTME
jgi:hypothetical protein